MAAECKRKETDSDLLRHRQTEGRMNSRPGLWRYSMGRWSPILLLAVLSLGLGKTGGPRRLISEHDWLQFSSPVLEGRGNQRGSISATNVASLAVAWRVALPGVSDGSPVYVANVFTSR